jgi:Family of unknown function (DUF5995)
MERSAGIGALVRRMEALLEPLEASADPGRFFLATYLRTTRAVAEELQRGGFRDPEWVERWDVAFAGLYHVLLGMNAHINYDLAQSLPAVISEPEFDDPELLAARHADHEHIDQVLVARVGAEDTELERLAAARVADLMAPGQVVLKLAVKGFGVRLADARSSRS